MATHARRFYDGETAQVHDVERAHHHQRAGDLPPCRRRHPGALADRRARGAGRRRSMKVTPPIVRKGFEARLVVDDPELRRQLAPLGAAAGAACRDPRPRRSGASPPSAPRSAVLVGLFWLAVDYGTEYAAPLAALQPAGQAGRERVRRADGRQGRVSRQGRPGGDERSRQPARQGGRLSARDHRARDGRRAGQRLHPAGRHPGLLFRPHRPGQGQLAGGGRDGARDRPCRALPSDEGPGRASTASSFW